MADPVFPDHIPASLDYAPPSTYQDIIRTDATTKTTTAETVVPHVLRIRSRYDIGKSSSAAQVHPVIDDPINRTISLILARLVRHDDTIDRFCDQIKDISLDRMEMIEHDVEALQARVDVAE
nr:hypothetical protein [Tanacetum cinerariifolium]